MTAKLPTLTLKLDLGCDDVGELVEDAPLHTGEATFELAEFLCEGEEYVGGAVMAARAKEMGGLTGEKDAQMLLARQSQIPEEWRAFYLVFPGTKRRGEHGKLHVPYLYWNGDKWHLNWNWLENDWNSNNRLVRLRWSCVSSAFGGGF